MKDLQWALRELAISAALAGGCFAAVAKQSEYLFVYVIAGVFFTYHARDAWRSAEKTLRRYADRCVELNRELEEIMRR